MATIAPSSSSGIDLCSAQEENEHPGEFLRGNCKHPGNLLCMSWRWLVATWRVLAVAARSVRSADESVDMLVADGCEFYALTIKPRIERRGAPSNGSNGNDGISLIDQRPNEGW